MDLVLAILLAVVLVIITILYQKGWYRVLLTGCHKILIYLRKSWKSIFRGLKYTENSLTEKEDNFLRMFRLMSNVAPKAVRDKFNHYYNPLALARDKALITSRLLNCRIINKKQMDLLYPTSGITSSENYDITLMICLLRNMTTIVPPSNGYDKLPPVTEVSDGADLARIKYYRNVLAHTDNGQLSNEHFNTMWICLSEAIIRLGGMTYKPKCEELSQINLNKDILTYIRQDLSEFREEIYDEIETLKKQTVSNQTSVTLLQAEASNIHSEFNTQGRNIRFITKNVTKKIENVALELKRHEEDTIPKNIRAQHRQYLDEWREDDKMFVITNATVHVTSSLKDNNIIVVTGSSGNGKSAIIHHVALELYVKYEYEVIPFVTGPQDIINFRDPRTKQVFVVDDICGKEAINASSVELWRDHLEKIEKIFNFVKKGKKHIITKSEFPQLPPPKLLISCRLHVYRDLQFQLLKLFTRNECNLLSTELRLSYQEKVRMVERYLPGKMSRYLDLGNFDFFPLLCKLAMGKNFDEANKLFTSPDDTIKDDLTSFIRCQNKYQLCALVLCILIHNGFDPNWLNLEYAPIDTIGRIEKIVNECDININRERQRADLKYCFKTLELTYLIKRGNLYIMIHDKIQEMAAFLYGQHFTECFIKYAPTSFVLDHYRFPSCKTKENDNIITLSEHMSGEYLNRMIRNLKEGDVIGTLSNKNLVVDTFRAEIVNIFQHDPEVRSALNPFCWNKWSFIRTTPLIEAATQGFSDIVKVLIDLKCDVNIINYLGKSPLFKACEGGHITVVKLLLDNGANLLVCDDHGLSLLHVSCLNGHLGVVKLLLDKSFKMFKKKKLRQSLFLTACELGQKDYIKSLKNGVNVSLVDRQGRSSLYLACKEGHTNIVKQLLEKHADVSRCNNRGQSPLIVACKGGFEDIVGLLLKMNANVNKKCKDGRASLHFACKGGYSSVVERLLQYKANVSQVGWAEQSPLYIASERGYTDVVEMLLKHNADVTQCGKYGKSPLFVACEAGHPYTVELLLENNADVLQCDKFGKSPLYMACKIGNLDIVKLLLEHFADINQCDQRKQFPLFVACEGGHSDIVKMLLKTNLSINKCDVHGQTPLHVACEGGHTYIVKILLDKGAKINQRGRAGQSPIYFSISRGHISVLNVLLDNNADVLFRDKYKRSPFYAACEMGYTHIVRLLLEHSADVFECDQFGNSPLHAACKGGHEEVVKLLLQKNANVNQCDKYGQSPLHIACKGNNSEDGLKTYDQGYREIVNILLEKNADVTLCDNLGFTALNVAKAFGNFDIQRLISVKQS